MQRLGIDLTSIKRFKKIRKSDYRHWSRVFTIQEWRYAFQDVHSAEHLAGIFAAKEAAMKALSLAGPAHFLDWEVRHSASGMPRLVSRKSKQQSRALLSISHDSDKAIATVIIV